MTASVGRRLLVLARPRLMGGVVVLPGLGWAWAHWDRALPLQRPGALLGVGLAWACLHVGTMWLNAARDRDEGPVLLGEPVEVPALTVPAGWGMLGVGVALAAWAEPLSGAWALLCAGLSVAYSHPWLGWKGHPVAGPLVNVVGYGLASPAAGWAVVGLPVTARTAVVGVGLMLGIAGCYFVAQAFQEEEDRARGDRTLVAMAGPGVTLGAARVAFGLAATLGLALVVAGWLPRLCGLGLLGAVAVDRHLARGQRLPEAGGVQAAVHTGRLLSGTTLAVVALAAVQYGIDARGGGAVAGLATAAGHPPVDLRWLARLAGG